MPLQPVGTGRWKNELYHSLPLKFIMLHKYWDRRARAPETLVVKTTFLSEHYVYNCNLSLQFRNKLTSFDKLKPNSITLAGSELVGSWFESYSVMEFGFEPASNQLRTS